MNGPETGRPRGVGRHGDGRHGDGRGTPSPGHSATMRRVARRMEVRAFGLVPENFSLAEGLRAGLIVAGPLLAVLVSGRGVLGWAIFAAFWTCLCVSPGSERRRRRLLALFVGLGTVMTFMGSWAAGLGPQAPLPVVSALVFLAILLPARVAYGGLLATLLAVVAVVAVGYPLPAGPAAVQALAFLLGAGWAWVVIHGLWRIDPRAPLDLAARAVVARLVDMAAELVATGAGPHRDARWHAEHGEHRRAVRLALERLRALRDIYADEPAAVLVAHARVQRAAETVFSALIALDHAFIRQLGPAEERIATARALRNALDSWRRASGPIAAQTRGRERWIAQLRRRRGALQDELVIGCLIALEQALAGLRDPGVDALLEKTAPARPASPQPRPGVVPVRAALRQALRQALGVAAVMLAARLFHMGYPWWGTMAVVVVLQPGTRVTWTRCLERICGSLLGGALAAGLLGGLHVEPVLAMLVLAVLVVVLSGLAIALRTVNYTIFVLFLTVVFVVVTEMLHPGTGIASARVLDNTIGSLVAMVAVLAVWPDKRPALPERIAAGLVANWAYLAAVMAGASDATIDEARRGAGLASIEMEMALHDPSGLLWRARRLSIEDMAALEDLRRLAGEAAAAWHRRLAETASAPPVSEGMRG